MSGETTQWIGAARSSRRYRASKRRSANSPLTQTCDLRRATQRRRTSFRAPVAWWSCAALAECERRLKRCACTGVPVPYPRSFWRARPSVPLHNAAEVTPKGAPCARARGSRVQSPRPDGRHPHGGPGSEIGNASGGHRTECCPVGRGFFDVLARNASGRAHRELLNLARIVVDAKPSERAVQRGRWPRRSPTPCSEISSTHSTSSSGPRCLLRSSNL